MTEQTPLDRLDRLERQNRRLRRLLLALAATAGSAVWMAQVAPFPPELRAQRLVLVNADGEARIELRADGAAPVITLRDGSDVLIELSTRGDRGSIRYLDEQGRLRDLAAPMGPRPIVPTR